MSSITGRRRRRPQRVVASPAVSPAPAPPSAEEPSHLAIGRVAGARGVRGELRVSIESDDSERFHRLEQVYLGEERVPKRVLAVRLHRGQALLMIEGITNRDAAEVWRGAYLYVAAQDALPLGEDEYYHHQIEGLEAVSEDGELLGRVTEVLVTGANDVYVVRGPGSEILLPAIKDVILSIDLQAGRMTVRLMEGLR